MATLNQEQLNQLKQKGLSDQDITALSSKYGYTLPTEEGGRSNLSGGFGSLVEPLVNASKFIVRDVSVGATPQETESKGGFVEGVKSFAKNVFQSTLGSKGLAGVAQMPGKVIGQKGMYDTQADTYDTVSNLSQQATDWLNKAKAEPAKAEQYKKNANDILSQRDELLSTIHTLEDRNLTQGKVAGTTLNSLLTIATAGTGSLAGKLSPKFGQLTKGTSDISKGISAARKLGNIAEQGLIGVGFNTASNLQEGNQPFEGSTGAFILGGFLPIAVTGASKVLTNPSSKLISSAQRLYQSALKPSTTLGKDGMNNVVKTGLKEGIVLTEAGIEKTANRINAMEEALGEAITEAGAKNGMVKTAPLRAFVEETKKAFSNISDVAQSEKATQEIDTIINNFLSKYGDEVPIEKAQEIKVATYQWLKNAYGDLASPTKEANKQLIRGLKEGIVDVAPTVKNINSRLKALYEFDEQLSKSAGRLKNANLLGLGEKILASSGSNTGLVLSLVSKILGGATNKSRIAIYMNKLGEVMQKMTPLQRSQVFIDNPIIKNLYQRAILNSKK